MGYTMAVFGLERETDEATLLGALAAVAKGLEEAHALPGKLAAVVTRPDPARPLRWLAFFSRTSDPTELSQGSVLKRLSAVISPVILAVHDDRSGLYSFVRTERGSIVTALQSDGPFLQIIRGEITVDYPQKGYSRDELELLNAKSDDELSDAELKAVAEYQNALKLGLSQYYPAEDWGQHLKVLYDGVEGWWLTGEKGALATPKPIGKDVASVTREMKLALFPEQIEKWYIDALSPEADADDADELEDPEVTLADLDEAIATAKDPLPLRLERLTLLSDALERYEDALAEAAALRAAGVSTEDLFEAEANAFSRLGRQREARDAIAHALELDRENATHWYNHACYTALLAAQTRPAGNPSALEQEALASLARAIELDPVNREDAANDGDFDSLRASPRFLALVKQA
ncbi:MAG: hypothetical protein IPJ65_10705 [Archangiaceae bacterium]|nr:hypothetical protein [Archangiaceae bacterium]